MRSWLIIGGHGYIGRSLVNSVRHRFPFEKITVPSRSELIDVMALPNRLVGLHIGRVNVVILAAAGVSGVMDATGIEFNASWIPAAAIAMAQVPNVSVLVTGSSFEYGASGVLEEALDPVTSILAPVEAYGISKRDGFDILKPEIAALGSLGYARIFQVWGGSEYPLRLAPSLTENARRSQMTQLNSGSTIRDFIHVEDVSRQIIDYFEFSDKYPKVFNVCSGEGVTVLEFAKRLLSSMNYDPAELLESSDSASHPYPRLVGVRQPIFGDSIGFSIRL